MLRTRNVENNVQLLLIYSMATSSVFALPILILYYHDEIGLSFADFLIAEAVFAAIVVALEVPTGWLSDVWKRKHVLAIACLFNVIGHGLLLMADSLAMAIAAQAIIAIQISLISGTNSALLYDSLLEKGQEDQYCKKESIMHGYSLYVLGFSCAIGGFLYSLHHDAPIWASIVIQAVGFVSALLMVEPERHKKTVEGNPLKDMFVTMRYAITHVEIGVIIIFTAVIFSCTKLMMWTQQPYYDAMNVPEIWFGLLMAIGFLIGGLSSHYGHLISNSSNMKILITGWVIACLVSIICGIIIWWHGVILLMLTSSLLYGWLTPRIKDAINKRVDSSRRATILSTQNLMVSILFVPLSLALAAIVASQSLGAGLVSLGLWAIFAGFITLIYAKIRGTKKQ